MRRAIYKKDKKKEKRKGLGRAGRKIMHYVIILGLLRKKPDSGVGMGRQKRRGKRRRRLVREEEKKIQGGNVSLLLVVKGKFEVVAGWRIENQKPLQCENFFPSIAMIDERKGNPLFHR